MRTKKVIVLPYDPRWKQDFEAIRQELQAALGDCAMAIEHVGSTSVEGLAAKPVIDIDVVIEKEEALGKAIECLEKIGYTHEGNLGIEGREAFKYSGKAHLKKHHLYVCPQDSPELKRHIVFREYLRSHPSEAGRYGAVKEEGAKRYSEDIDGYIAHKLPCIEGMYRRCGLLQPEEDGN